MDIVSSQAEIKKLMRFFEHPKAGTWQRVELDIKRNRMGWGTLYLKDGNGKPLANQEIKVKQLTHDFKFGCNAFKLKDFECQEKNDAYEMYFKRVFNEAVVSFLWDTLEPVENQPRFSADSPRVERRPPVDVMLDWCEENQIAPKGHWLFCDNFAPAWLSKDSREVMHRLEKRIALLGERYGTRIRKWDVLNETFTYHPRHNPGINDASVPADYAYMVFKMAEKYFPVSNEFIYNDGEFISFGAFAHDSSPMFLFADRLLRRGVKLDGLGMQFHMYGNSPEVHSAPENRNYFDPVHLLNVMDQLGKLNMPLHISEISLTTYPDLPRELAEEVQAQLLYNLYRVWFSQRNCASIVYWNMCDKTAFGLESRFDACLIDADFKEKPSYRMLDRLVNKEWHTETTIVTNADGEAEWNGFYGEYLLDIAGCHHKVAMTPRSENEYTLVL